VALQFIHPVDQLFGFVFGDIIAGDNIHVTIIFRDHHNAEGRLFTCIGAGVRSLNAIADDILHQFDKN
jgi:hypothetical protein